MPQNVEVSLTAKANNLIAPLFHVSQLAIDNFDKVSKLQLASAIYYAEIGLDDLRAAAKIRNVDGIGGFAKHHIEAIGGIHKKIMDDGRQLADLGSHFKDEIGTLFAFKKEIEKEIESEKENDGNNASVTAKTESSKKSSSKIRDKHIL